MILSSRTLHKADSGNRPLPSYRVPLFQNESSNFSYENDFDFHENEPVRGTVEIHRHVNGFARRLVLAERQKAARKRSIAKSL